MSVNETKMGWLCLVLAFTLNAGLLASGSHESKAYFVDTKSGTITGTVESANPLPTIPFRLEPGASRALHWGPGGDGPASGLQIAQVDLSGAISLDFGETLPGHGDSRPDVFRLVSLADGDRRVTFNVTGPIAGFVTCVRLGDSASGLLTRGATSRVSVRIRIPDDVAPGMYSGAITVHVQGWASDSRLPMTLDVYDRRASDRGKHDNDGKDCSKEGGRFGRKESGKQGGNVRYEDRRKEKSVAPPSAETSATPPPASDVPAPLPAPAPIPAPEPLPNSDATSTPAPTSTPSPTTTVGVRHD